MIVLKIVQGTPEWIEARLGIPTASNFDRILTPGGKPSSQCEKYLNQLLAERLISQPCADDAGSPWMERGNTLEQEARNWYALQNDVDPERIGLALRPDQRAACSPDALVGEDGLLEIKVPGAATHIGYLRDSIGEKYKPQIQGQLWVTGRQWVDFISYCPGMPANLKAAQVRVVRDEAFIELLNAAVPRFCDLLDEALADLLSRKKGQEVAA